MSEFAHVGTVRRAYEAFGRGDLEALLGVFADDVEWVTPGPPELPTAGRRRGHQDVRSFFHTVMQLFDFERFEPKEFVAQGEAVVVIGEETVRLRTTGARVDWHWVHVFDFRNGKVARFREYGDAAPLLAALRADPVAAQ